MITNGSNVVLYNSNSSSSSSNNNNRDVPSMPTNCALPQGTVAILKETICLLDTLISKRTSLGCNIQKVSSPLGITPPVAKVACIISAIFTPAHCSGDIFLLLWKGLWSPGTCDLGQIAWWYGVGFMADAILYPLI